MRLKKAGASFLDHFHDASNAFLCTKHEAVDEDLEEHYREEDVALAEAVAGMSWVNSCFSLFVLVWAGPIAGITWGYSCDALCVHVWWAPFARVSWDNCLFFLVHSCLTGFRGR